MFPLARTPCPVSAAPPAARAEEWRTAFPACRHSRPVPSARRSKVVLTPAPQQPAEEKVGRFGLSYVALAPFALLGVGHVSIGAQRADKHESCLKSTPNSWSDVLDLGRVS